MNHLVWIVAAAAALPNAALPAAAVPAVADAQGVDALAWLSGDWEQSREAAPNVTEWTVERWSAPRVGVMLGTSLTGRRTAGPVSTPPADRPRAFEFMRISPGEGGRLTYFASPGGQPAVAFPMVRMERFEVVFENAAHDYPQRISYRWDANIIGEFITATISMIDGSRPMTWTYRRPQPVTRP